MKREGKWSRDGKYFLPETVGLIKWIKEMGLATKVYANQTKRLEKSDRQMPLISHKFCKDGLLIRVRRKAYIQLIVVHASSENSEILANYLEKGDHQSYE